MTKSKKTNYRKLNTELDDILASLGAADVDIDDTLKLYERGMEIIEKLQTYIKEQENRVRKVKKSWGKTNDSL